MSIPGFTADASLFELGKFNQATRESSPGGALVQPASPFSDVIYRERFFPVAGLRRSTVFDPCYWRHRCQNIYDPRPELRGKVDLHILLGRADLSVAATGRRRDYNPSHKCRDCHRTHHEDHEQEHAVT